MRLEWKGDFGRVYQKNPPGTLQNNPKINQNSVLCTYLLEVPAIGLISAKNLTSL